MLTVIVAGRNDNYGKDFRQRFFRTALHNAALFGANRIEFEYMLAEWNPLPDRPTLSEEFVDRVPNARTVIIPPEVHHKYNLNPQMPFHEMAAKNAALRRARGDIVIVTNADILFSEEIVHRIAAGGWAADTLYRAHRIDVKPELDWDDIQNPSNQLPSGEGNRCPPYYLGAGGDFCLAVRNLWCSLGGFNERIRFSTRAKDWQFFLSAAAQGIGMEFIGNVYHLDHEDGFRNSGSRERNSDAVHFGMWWDIEFGLPLPNAPDWGFSKLQERPFMNDPRMIALESKDYVVHEEQNRLDSEMMMWLTRPPDSCDTATAILLHSICGAHREQRRLICRIKDPRLAVTLSGFDTVASRFGVEIFCNWNWPETPGYIVRPFANEPTIVREIDWILEERDRGIRVFESGTGSDIQILPHAVQMNEPEFSPVLARRLLFAYLRLQERGTARIAIYGAGSHTQSLLRWGLPDNIEFAAIVESLSEVSEQLFPNGAAILLSSSSFESDMLEACRTRGIHNVIALYSDWPRDMWSNSARVYA